MASDSTDESLSKNIQTYCDMHRKHIMKLNLNPLMEDMVVPMLLSLVIVQAIVSSPATLVQAMPSGPDLSQLSLSSQQQKQLRNLQLEIKPKILAELNPSQQKQLETSFSQGQSLWQGLASMDLTKKQQSKIQNIMKSQRSKIAKILTPEQRAKLMRSGKPPF
jgi:Spy/CpxP family protein refolding chaperone